MGAFHPLGSDVVCCKAEKYSTAHCTQFLPAPLEKQRALATSQIPIPLDTAQKSAHVWMAIAEAASTSLMTRYRVAVRTDRRVTHTGLSFRSAVWAFENVKG